MTKIEAAIVSAYTGILIGNFSDMHEYVNEIMGRHVFTHEMGFGSVAAEIKEKSAKDFLSIKITDE